MAKSSRKVGEFVVEAGVPAPPRQSTQHRRYPFIEMQVGESVFVEGAKPNSLRGSLQYAAMKTGFKFVNRAESGGVRVWRTA